MKDNSDVDKELNGDLVEKGNLPRAKRKNVFVRGYTFFTQDIWLTSESEIDNKIFRTLLHPFRIVAYTLKGYKEHDISVRSAALTFFTLMSVVPILALIFGIAKGFGLETHIEEYLYRSFSQFPEAVDSLITFAYNMLEKTKGGLIASIGLIVLLWYVIKVFNHVEKAFNAIWEVKKERSFTRKVGDYIAVVFVTPILGLGAMGAIQYIRKNVAGQSGEWFVELLIWLVSLVVMWLIFSMIYKVMPNTRVKPKGALIAGAIVGTTLVVIQFFYFTLQRGVSSYNVIYGTFAAIPLFLVWLKTSWMVVLVGAELSFAYQNIKTYQQELQSMHVSYDTREKVMIATMVVAADNYLNGRGAMSSEDIATELNLPVRIIRDVLFRLEKAEFLVTLTEKDDRIIYYIPNRDVNTLTIRDIIDGVELVEDEEDIKMDMPRKGYMRNIVKRLDRMREEMQKSKQNALIVDMIK